MKKVRTEYKGGWRKRMMIQELTRIDEGRNGMKGCTAPRHPGNSKLSRLEQVQSEMGEFLGGIEVSPLKKPLLKTFRLVEQMNQR